MIKVIKHKGGFQVFPRRKDFIEEIRWRLEETGNAVKILQGEYEFIVYKANKTEYFLFTGEEFTRSAKFLESIFSGEEKDYRNIYVSNIEIKITIDIYEG